MTTPDRGAHQRKRLVDAYVAIVAENGHSAATVRAICQRAGVANATYYQLFGSKEALFLRAWDRGTATLVHAAGSAIKGAREATWAEQVEAAMTAFLTLLASNPTYARFATVEILKAGPWVQSRVDQLFESTSEMLAQAQVRAREEPPNEQLGPVVIGGVYARICSYIAADRTAELPDLAGPLTHFILDGLRGSEPSGQRARQSEGCSR